MFWIVMALLLVAAGIGMAGRRRRYESVEEEPWRASLDDDEPLDVDAARRAEEEFLTDDPTGEADEPWS
jgi:hypothetical protein